MPAAPSTAADRLAASAHAALAQRGQVVACAESLTGGELAALLSGTPGASATFAGGVVPYATALKRSLLGVTAERVVSAECAQQMAAGARALLGADWALATTGVAGPESQEDQPVGTVFLGLASARGCRALQLALPGDRPAVRSATCHAALQLLLEELEELEDA